MDHGRDHGRKTTDDKGKTDVYHSIVHGLSSIVRKKKWCHPAAAPSPILFVTISS